MFACDLSSRHEWVAAPFLMAWVTKPLFLQDLHTSSMMWLGVSKTVSQSSKGHLLISHLQVERVGEFQMLVLFHAMVSVSACFVGVSDCMFWSRC